MNELVDEACCIKVPNICSTAEGALDIRDDVRLDDLELRLESPIFLNSMPSSRNEWMDSQDTFNDVFTRTMNMTRLQ